MNSSDGFDNTEQANTTIAIEISNRIRSTMALSLIVFALLVSILYIHKPTVKDSDVLNATYPFTFAADLHQEAGADIIETLRSREASLDYPWNEIARQYVRRGTHGDAPYYLETYLNEDSQGRERQLLLLVDSSAEVRGKFMSYLEATKDRWQSFALPFLGIIVSRDEIALYLTGTYSALHLLALLKWHYLLRMRHSKPDLSYIPDPSLLTAAYDDFDILQKWERWLVAALQLAIWALVPVAGTALLLYYFIVIGDMAFAERTRLFVATLGSSVTSAIIIVYFSCWRVKPAQQSLFKRKTV